MCRLLKRWLVSKFARCHDYRNKELIHVIAMPGPDDYFVRNVEYALVAWGEPHLFAWEHHPTSPREPFRFLFIWVPLYIDLRDDKVNDSVLSSIARKSG